MNCTPRLCGFKPRRVSLTQTLALEPSLSQPKPEAPQTATRFGASLVNCSVSVLPAMATVELLALMAV